MSDISNSRSVGGKSLFNTIYRSFGLGDDIFISHSRTDGINYARSLARLLQKNCQLKCFADFYWTESGEKLPPFLVKKLKRSTILVVVMSEGANKRSHNIKEEIEIFRKTGRPILIVDLDNKYQKHNWTELCGISVIKELSNKQITLDKKIAPSPTVLESISESFNYKTKYDQQRRSARTALALLFLSLASVIGVTIYANKMIAQAQAATKEKNTAVEEKNQAQTERETAVQEKTRINQELAILQEDLSKTRNDLNATQTTLKTKEADLALTKSSLTKNLKEKQTAEAELILTKSNLTNTLEEKQKTQTELGLTKLNLTNTLEEKQKAEAEMQTAKAETQISREKETEARENIKSLDIRAMGSQASLLSATTNQEFAALKLATEAVEKELERNSNSFENLSAEVQKGLTDSIIRLNFARPLKNDLGEIINTEISGDGKLIFGSIHDAKEKKLRRVVWETARPDKYYLLGEEPFDPSPIMFFLSNDILNATFSRDGKWLFVPSNHKIEAWKIDLEDGNNKFTSIPTINLTANEKIRQIASNKDGTQIAIIFYSSPVKIKIINRKDIYFDLGEYRILRHGVRSMAFSPQDELIIDNDENDRRFYNLTKGKFILKDELKLRSFDYELEGITDFGDILLKKRDGILLFNDALPKYILISSLDGSVRQSWDDKSSDSKSRFGYISSLKFINHNSVKVGKVNNRFIVTGHTPSPYSFVYDFKEMELFTPLNLLEFYFFKDKNTMGISNGMDTGITDQQTGRWSRINELKPNWLINMDMWLEKTDKYLYLGFNGLGVNTKPSLRIKNLRENKTVQCEIDKQQVQLKDTVLLYEKYLAIIIQENSNDFFLSIYDPDDCRKIVRIKLEIPEYRLKGSNSEYPVNHLYISSWYIDRNNVLKGLLKHSQVKENYSREGFILDNYFLITCDLSKIKLLHNSTIEKETKLSMNIHEFPFDTAKYQWVSLVNNNFGAMIWMENYIDQPLLFEFRNNKWSKRVLEFNASEPNNLYGNSIFSSSGDSVAIIYGLTVRIWDTATGKRKLTLTIPEDIGEGELLNSVFSSDESEGEVLQKSQRFVFSPDGKSIGVVTKDKQIKFYPTSIEEYYYIAKELLK